MNKLLNNIKPEVIELAKVIKSKIAPEGVVNADDVDEVYINTLPEDISEDTIKSFQKHNGNFIPAAALAFGELSIEEFKKDKDLKSNTISIPMIGRDLCQIVVNRETEVSNPKTREIKDVYGNINVKMVTHAAKTSRPSMSSVRDYIRESALAAFGEK